MDSATPQPAVVAFSPHPFEPTVVRFVDATLEVMLVKRRALRQKRAIDRATWAVPGAYVLLGPPSEAGMTIRARPGKASDLLGRMNDHLADPDMAWFTRAALIRDTRQFNSAQAGFIEGVLHQICRDSAAVQHESRMDTDETLVMHERQDIEEHFIPRVRAVLEIVGVPTETSQQADQEDRTDIRLRPPGGDAQ